MLGEKDFEGMQLLRDAFDIVEPVDADDEFDAVELLFESGDTVLHLGFLEALLEFFRVDANWKRAHGDNLVVELDTVGSGWKGTTEDDEL